VRRLTALTASLVLGLLAACGDDAPTDEQQVRETLSGNLCRCTGYGTIVEAVLAASVRMKGDS